MWSYSKDKDFEENRKNDPERFPYESTHYILKNNKDFSFNEVNIPVGIPCEVQIRTLLQHAYAELSHDILYKKNILSEGNVKRFLARSMALVDSADYFFLQAKKDILTESKIYEAFLDISSKSYPSELLEFTNKEANLSILDSVLTKKLISNNDIEPFREYLQKKSTSLQKSIKTKHHLSFIYRLPAILILYFLVDKKSSTLRDNPILSYDILEQLYSDRSTTYYIE